MQRLIIISFNLFIFCFYGILAREFIFPSKIDKDYERYLVILPSGLNTDVKLENQLLLLSNKYGAISTAFGPMHNRVFGNSHMNSTNIFAPVIIRNIYTLPFLQGYAVDLLKDVNGIQLEHIGFFQLHDNNTSSNLSVLDFLQHDLKDAQIVEKCGTVSISDSNVLKKLSSNSFKRDLHGTKNMSLVTSGKNQNELQILDEEEEYPVQHHYLDILSKIKSFNAIPTENISQKSSHTPKYLTEPSAPWNLDRLNRKSISGIQGNYTYNEISGANVTVYVIDSGINTQHLDFEGRATFPIDFSESGELEDDLGHGTHVAGIIGGRIFGVAKKVTLVGIKVFGARGSTSWATILEAFQWAYLDIRARKEKKLLEEGASKKDEELFIVNLSLRGDFSDAANKAIAGFHTANIPVVVSAGNDGANSCLFSPGSSPHAITVGATSMLDTFLEVPPSNYGSCVKVIAPGGNILSTFVGSQYALYRLSGTSMAAPHVTGALALLWSCNRHLSSDQITRLLFSLCQWNSIADVPLHTPNIFLQVKGKNSDSQTSTMSNVQKK